MANGTVRRAPNGYYISNAGAWKKMSASSSSNGMSGLRSAVPSSSSYNNMFGLLNGLNDRPYIPPPHGASILLEGTKRKGLNNRMYKVQNRRWVVVSELFKESI